MAHQRMLIRKAIVATLTGVTSAGARVSATRIEPHKKTQLPAISVYTLTDPVDEEASMGTAPRELTHLLQVVIEGVVADTDELPVDDALDNLAEQIELAMDENWLLASGGKFDQGVNTCGDSQLKNTDIAFPEDSDPKIGIIQLTYTVTYRNGPNAPTDGMGDFVTVDAKHQITGGVADTIPAEDTFTVQES